MPDQLVNLVIPVFSWAIVYGLIRWLTMKATHPFRIEVGQEAARLASDDRVTEYSRKVLRKMVEVMYKPTSPWLAAISMILAALINIFIPRIDYPKLLSTLSADPEVAMQVLWVRIRLFFALITTSPLAFVIAATFLIVSVLLFSTVIVLLRWIVSSMLSNSRTPSMMTSVVRLPWGF